jgi:hypothetical protein
MTDCGYLGDSSSWSKTSGVGPVLYSTVYIVIVKAKLDPI